MTNQTDNDTPYSNDTAQSQSSSTQSSSTQSANVTPIRACLFDLDGTLLDTAEEFRHCLNWLNALDGHAPLTKTAFNRAAISRGARAIIGDHRPDLDETALDERLKSYLARYQDILGQHTTYFDGIESLIDMLEARQIAWGIVTNKPTTYTQGLLKHFPRLARAGCVVCGDTLATKKPCPKPLLHAAGLIQHHPAQTLYVGDAPTDMMAAASAGMRGVWAGYGYVNGIQLTEPTHWQVNHPDDLTDYILQTLAETTTSSQA